MSGTPITFVSHTNKPGGGELALRRYLESTALSVRLVTLEGGGVWHGLQSVVHVNGLIGLRRALRGGGVVVANSMRAAFLTSLVAPRRTRLVYWVRDGLTESAMSPLALWLTRHVTARRASRYLANSQWTASTVHEAMGVGRDKIDVVYSMCGVTDESLRRSPRTAPHRPLRLLFLGRLSPWKAPDVAVRALEQLRTLGVGATLTIAGSSHFGEDAYADEVRVLAAHDPAVTLLGHVEDVGSLLESHDILVHCSTVPEPFGQVIVQGLGAGMPVVATDAGGPQEILADAPHPLLYEAGAVDALAQAIHRSSQASLELSKWALARVARFTDETSTQACDEVLRDLQAMPAAARSKPPN